MCMEILVALQIWKAGFLCSKLYGSLKSDNGQMQGICMHWTALEKQAERPASPAALLQEGRRHCRAQTSLTAAL